MGCNTGGDRRGEGEGLNWRGVPGGSCGVKDGVRAGRGRVGQGEGEGQGEGKGQREGRQREGQRGGDKTFPPNRGGCDGGRGRGTDRKLA